MSDLETSIFIRNLQLLARIGIHGHEQGAPQPVRINVRLSSPTKTEIDRLESAIDYEAVTEKIRTIVAAGHINLAETLAERIAEACLADARVTKCMVRVEKLNALPGAEAAQHRYHQCLQVQPRDQYVDADRFPSGAAWLVQWGKRRHLCLPAWRSGPKLQHDGNALALRPDQQYL